MSNPLQNEMQVGRLFPITTTLELVTSKSLSGESFHFDPTYAMTPQERDEQNQPKQLVVCVQRLTETARMPEYANPLDSCFDIFTDAAVEIPRGGTAKVGTGIAIQAPIGWDFQFEDKSGHAANFGLFILGGVIDPGYDGELKVIVGNLGTEPVAFDAGTKICQVRIQRRVRALFLEAKTLEDRKDRGAQGFGSSGLTSKHQYR